MKSRINDIFHYEYPFRFAFKWEFNLSDEVLALRAMESNILVATNCLTVDTLRVDRFINVN